MATGAAAVALLTTAGALTANAAPTAPAAPAAPARAAACGDGSYQAEAVLNGSTWTARRGSSTVYTGGDMRAAVQAAVNSLTSGRTAKERVVVRGSGSISAGSRISPATPSSTSAAPSTSPAPVPATRPRSTPAAPVTSRSST
jgi:hypothetical protein